MTFIVGVGVLGGWLVLVTALVMHVRGVLQGIAEAKDPSAGWRCGNCDGRPDDVTITKSAHMRAHQCPHGKWCVRPYSARRQGEKPQACESCFTGRQLALDLDSLGTGNPIRSGPEE